MSEQKCPYCGAEKEVGTDNFECGNSYEAIYPDSQVDRTIYCYEHQVEKLKAEIDRLETLLYDID